MRRPHLLASLSLLSALSILPGCAQPPQSAGATPLALASAGESLAKLRAFTLADLQAASADAKAQLPPDQTASQCYDFLAGALPQLPAGGAVPTVGAAVAFQKARDLANGANAQTGFLKAMNLACAPLVTDVNFTLAKLGLMAGGASATGGALAPLAGVLPLLGPTLPIPLQ